MRRGRNTSPQPPHSTVPYLVLDEWHERYPGASHRMGHRRIQWRKRKELALATLYERDIRGLRITNSLNRATLQLEARLL
jgi:hypothetical protein